MKILFISFNDITDEKYGDGQCNRNQNALDSIVAIVFQKFLSFITTVRVFK